MQNFQGTFEYHKGSFISAFSICVTVPLREILNLWNNKDKFAYKPNN